MRMLMKLRRLVPFWTRILPANRTRDLGELVDMPEGYAKTNPSFLDLPNGRLVCVRGVNYRLASTRTMRPIFSDGSHYRSVARFAFIGADGRVAPAPSLNEVVGGGEDVRLFSHRDGVWACFSSPLVAESGQDCCRIWLAQFTMDLRLVSSFPLSSPYGFAREKNWSPFSHAGSIHFLYSFDPLVVIRLNDETRELEFVKREWASRPPSTFSFLLCGSSAGLPVGDKFLFVAHKRTIRLPSLKKVYVHRCVVLDPASWTLEVDQYFAIEKAEIQFVSGAAFEGEDVELSYGRMDSSALISSFGKSALAPKLLPRE